MDDESSTVSNYTGGEPAGASWTEKVMSFKGSQPLPQDQQEGVDEDEWVSILVNFHGGKKIEFASCLNGSLCIVTLPAENRFMPWGNM